jgi:riboflavin kinase/FMN adenylyltransferase
MRILRHFHNVAEADRGAVVALGNFDGLHHGHRTVIGEAGRIARATGAPLGVLTFEPHPRLFFQPDTVPFRLTPFRPKMRLLEELGVDITYNLRFGPGIAGRLAPEFVIDVLVEGFGISHLVVGPNFVFGKGRHGNAYILRQMAAREGFGFTEVEPVMTGDQGGAKGDGRMYASTDIRVLVRRGQVDEAAARLGRAWEIEARVQHGDARGTTLGYPTANLPVVGALHPDPGIYAVRVGMIENGVFGWHNGAAYIGTRPTFAGEETLLEVFLLDFKGDLYGKRLRVAFVERVRGDKAFDNPEALIAQMDLDCDRAREILGRETAPPAQPALVNA